MTNPTTCLFVLCACCALTLPAAAQTQPTPAPTEPGYATLSFGGQVGSHSFTVVSTPQIYGEPASISSAYKTGGGGFVDIGGGYRVWRKLSVGLTYSHFGDRSPANVTALIPNPIIVNSYRGASTTANDLKRSEDALHIPFSWPVPLGDKFGDKLRILGFIGPSFIHVSQDVVTNINLAEGAPPFSTVTISSVSTSAEKGWGAGVNVGVDTAYKLTTSFDAGLLLRYTGATATLTGPTGEQPKAKAGGFQIGAGLRYRF
jgi:outer membrane protein with beta-barrel domain